MIKVLQIKTIITHCACLTDKGVKFVTIITVVITLYHADGYFEHIIIISTGEKCVLQQNISVKLFKSKYVQ